MKKTRAKNIYQFKITLLGIEPEIWRRIQVPDNYTFWDLHVALQDAMGWCDTHLHEFRLRSQGVKVNIGIPADDGFEYDDDLEAGWEIMIADLFDSKGKTAEYIYDFGDNWRHRLVFEDILSRSKNLRYPRCVDGERACPPEDCGSIPGYENLLETIVDPKNEEYEDMVMWLTGHVKKYWPYRPDYFDPKRVKFDDPDKRWQLAFTDED